MSALNLFDLLIVACGVYMIYSGIVMKTKGKINTGVVLGHNADPDSIKDKEGFVAYMWWKLALVGIICTLAGLFNVAMENFGGDTQASAIIQLVMNLFFFLLLMVYGFIAVKAQKKYIDK